MTHREFDHALVKLRYADSIACVRCGQTFTQSDTEHSPRVHGDNLVVEAREPRLPPWPRSLARTSCCDPAASPAAVRRSRPFRACGLAVTRVAAVVAGLVVLGRAE
jgi:hypothetical protein